VPDHVAKEYGINLDTEVPKWAHENDYGNLGGNDLDDWLANNPEGRVCMKDGKQYKMKGEVLCAIPKWVQAQVDADNNHIADRVGRGEACDPSDGYDFPYETGNLSEQEIERRRAESAESIKEMLKDSRTRGLPWEQAVAMFTPEQNQATLDHWTWKDRSVTPSNKPPITDNQLDNRLDKTAETIKNANRGRGGTYAMGAHLKDGKLVRA